jgi:hypothetical protein
MQDEFETDMERYIEWLLEGKSRMEKDEILGRLEQDGKL